MGRLEVLRLHLLEPTLVQWAEVRALLAAAKAEGEWRGAVHYSSKPLVVVVIDCFQEAQAVAIG